MSGRPYRVELYKDEEGQYRWRVIAPGGRVLALSGQGYSSARAARHALHEVLAQERPYSVEVRKDEAEMYRWQLVTESGDVLAVAGQRHATEQAALRDLEELREHAPTAQIVEVQENKEEEKF